MIFWLNAAFAIALISLALGGALLYFLKAHKFHHNFCKFISYFVVIASFILLVCTAYYGTKYWFDGYFEKPFSNSKHTMFKHHKDGIKELKPARKHPKTADY